MDPPQIRKDEQLTGLAGSDGSEKTDCNPLGWEQKTEPVFADALLADGSMISSLSQNHNGKR